MEIRIIAVAVLILAAVCLGVIIAQELPKESIYEDLEDIDEEELELSATSTKTRNFWRCKNDKRT